MNDILSVQDYNNIIAFMNRCNLSGEEAETHVELKYRVLAAQKDLIEREEIKAPAAGGKAPPKKSAKSK